MNIDGCKCKHGRPIVSCLGCDADAEEDLTRIMAERDQAIRERDAMRGQVELAAKLFNDTTENMRWRERLAHIGTLFEAIGYHMCAVETGAADRAFGAHERGE